MASPLDAIARQVASAFRGRLRVGTLRRPGGGTLDEHGDITPGTPELFTFEGVRDAYSAFARIAAGIPAEDVVVLVLLGSVKPATIPRQGDQIKIEGAWHQVRAIPEVDPASATARCQCFVVPEPD